MKGLIIVLGIVITTIFIRGLVKGRNEKSRKDDSQL